MVKGREEEIDGATLNPASIVRITDLRGSNKCEVEYTNGEKMLAILPSKYKKVVWIRKGDFAVTEAQAEQKSTKVRTTISVLLTPSQIKDLKKQGKWPKEFTEKEKKETKPIETGDDEDDELEIRGGDVGDDEGDDELFVNSNHVVDPETESDDDDDDDED